MKIIFFENSYTKCGEETGPKPFSKKSKLRISLDQQPEILQFFYCMAKSRTTKIYLTQGADHLLLPYMKLCKKSKVGLELESQQKIFCMISEEKYGYLCFLAPGPGPQPRPQFVFDGPGPKFVFDGPGPQFVFTGPGPQCVRLFFVLQLKFVIVTCLLI